MRRRCPNKSCLTSQRCSKIGFYFRKSDSQKINRFKCRVCRKSFSSATFSPCYRQNKRRVNTPLLRLLVSEVSMRRAALLLNINRTTVEKKKKFLAKRGKINHRLFLKGYEKQKANFVQFDEMETSEHSKCKPLSIALLVENKSRKILGFEVSVMPAKGHLAAISRKRYGFRPDLRRRGMKRLFKRCKDFIEPNCEFVFDSNPIYSRALKDEFPNSNHIRVKGRDSCIVGQGELKKIGFDPLFSFNHTAAMIRANVNRLARRTWCTTKKQKGLEEHLWIYINYHNTVLTT